MAITLNGSSQYLSGGPIYNPGSTFSMAIWVQRGSLASTLFAMGRADGGGSYGWSFPCTANTDNEVWKFVYTNGIGDDAFTQAPNIGTNTWAHFLYVRNGTSRKCWLNGTLKLNATGDPSYQTGASYGLFIGARNVGGSPANYWNGKLAEAAIWDGADVSAAITHLYTGAAAGKAANHADVGTTPTYYWTLDNTADGAVGGVNLTNNSGTLAAHSTDSLTITPAATTVEATTYPGRSLLVTTSDLGGYYL